MAKVLKLGLDGTATEVEEALPDLTPAPTITSLTARNAEKRYLVEVSGVIWNSWPVHSDRDSRALMTQERFAISLGLREDTAIWKFADGVFRVVSNADFIDMVDAVRLHVQTAFAMESVRSELIQSAQITTYEQLDAAWEGGA